MNGYGLNKYKQTSVTTANRGQILLMLYEGAIRFTKLAIDAIHRKDLADKGKYILKVQDILNELIVTLDHKIGGEVSRELERLYNYMIEQITEANIKNEAKPLETTAKLLETLYEGWAAALQQVNVKFGGSVEAAAGAELAARKQSGTPTK